MLILQLMCALCSTTLGLENIPLPRIDLYDPSRDFTCFDGGDTIPFAYVNDDYCDCVDGSDEPGTSACPNGTFFCKNAGYISQTIPSSRVNDGFCDCCDASDEYSTDKCEYICDIISSKANQSKEIKDQMFVIGNRLRIKLAAAGNRMKMEKEQEMIALENKKVMHLKVLEEKEYQKNITEKQKLEIIKSKRSVKSIQEQREEEEKKVANDIFSAVDTDHDGRLTRAEIFQRPIFDEDKDGIVSEEEYEYFFASEENVTRLGFYQTAWPKLKQLYLFDKLDFLRSTREHSEYIWDSDIINGEVDGENNQKYINTTKEIIKKSKEAWSEYESAKDLLESIEQEIASLKNVLTKDYGPDNEFAMLEGECYRYFDQTFHYKVCPFNKIFQSYRVDGPETILGTWSGWLGKDYRTMLYDRGEFCWKDYQRTVRVFIRCGLANQIVKVSEPTKCEYIFELESPAACKTPETILIHDEL